MFSCVVVSFDTLETGISIAASAAVSDIVEGNYDLNIPKLVALVTLLAPSSSGDWVIGFQVQSFKRMNMFHLSWLGTLFEANVSLALMI